MINNYSDTVQWAPDYYRSNWTWFSLGGLISKPIDIAVIGAGPYGLSVAAHLSRQNVDYRVFGKPMVTWREHMPRNMSLKSDGFASNLSAPVEARNSQAHTLASYCAQHNIPYDDFSIPVQLSTFVDYALDFQSQFVPVVDTRLVSGIDKTDRIFELRLEDGETISTKRIVLAVGISHFDYVPEVLSGLPSEFVSHSSAHHNLEHFRDRDVTVIGAGASAIDLSALLHEAGANVRLVARKSSLIFGSAPQPEGRSLWQKIRHPQSGLGPGIRSRLACDLPDLFSYLPAATRLEVVRRHLGPAAAWHLKPRVLGKVSTMLGYAVDGVQIRSGRIALTLISPQNSPETIETDHVIAATGYRVDIDRLGFIDKHLRSQIRHVEKVPVLSRNFESSIGGLYFVGIASAGTFGPLMRFVYGCSFAAHRTSKHLVC